MESGTPRRVLIVANRTAATPPLIAAVRERAEQAPCTFTLLVPALPDVVDPEDEAKKTLELAMPLLEEAAKRPVAGLVGPSDALLAVERTLVKERYDEVLISTLPGRVSAWLRRDLPARVERLGLPVTVVRARQRAAPIHYGAP